MAVIARLYARHHVGHRTALAAYEQVVGQLDAVPMLVAVHGVIAADDGCDNACAHFIHVLLQVGDEALARPGVGIPAVHEAVNEAILNIVHLGDVDEFQEVVEGRVNTASGSQAHQVQALATGLCIAEGLLDLRVFQDGVVGNGAVDLH